MKPAGRQQRRAKVKELVMFLLEQNENGLSVSYLQKTVDDSVRYRVSRHSMTKLLKAELETGVIETELDIEGRSVWKIGVPYRTIMET